MKSPRHLSKGILFSIILNLSFVLLLPYIQSMKADSSPDLVVYDSIDIHPLDLQADQKALKVSESFRQVASQAPRAELPIQEFAPLESPSFLPPAVSFAFEVNLNLGLSKEKIWNFGEGEEPDEMSGDSLGLSVDQENREPKSLTFLMPAYPRMPLKLGIEGYVIARFVVNKKGEVSQIEIIEREPKQGKYFDSAVINKLKSSKFEPGVRNGQPVKMTVEKKFRFELD